jgi:hypothetical protein
MSPLDKHDWHGAGLQNVAISSLVALIIRIFIYLFETGVAMKPRLALNSCFSCLSLPSAGITDVDHYAL